MFKHLGSRVGGTGGARGVRALCTLYLSVRTNWDNKKRAYFAIMATLWISCVFQMIK